MQYPISTLSISFFGHRGWLVIGIRKWKGQLQGKARFDKVKRKVEGEPSQSLVNSAQQHNNNNNNKVSSRHFGYKKRESRR